MFEYIQFYTKNLSNFTVLLLLGFIIAILDITIRKVVKGVYLNVRDNIRLKHGGGSGDGKEGLTTKKDSVDSAGTADGDGGSAENESCPKDCSAVDALRKRLTVLIENATKLQKDVKENNELIIAQQKTIENMKKAVQKLVEAGNKK